MATGSVAQASAADDASAGADRELDSLVVLAATPGVTLDRFAARLALEKGQDVEQQGFSFARNVSYPPVGADSSIERAVIALRPGSQDRMVTARFILADHGPSACVSARAFARRHGMLPAPPHHPDAVAPGEVGRTRYTVRIQEAQVSAATRAHADCLHEIFVWQRSSD